MYNNLPKGSEQMLYKFTKKNAAKGKENKSSNLLTKDILFDDPKLIEESRKEFAAEYLAKYGDANIERRAIPISDFPLPTSINQMEGIKQIDFNPDIYTDEYKCDTFYTIYKNYKETKNEVNKLKLKTLFNDINCREIDTIGKNKDDPSNWNIPDGQFRLLLNELDILEPYNANIKNIIQTRKKTKHPILGNLTAGKSKTKRKGKGIRKGIKRKTNKKQRKSYKNKI
jgi:hypothetical protein